MTIDQINNELNDLLLKYHSGEITSEEFRRLIEMANDSSDDELRDVLKAQWDNFEDFENLSDDKINDLYDKIRPEKPGVAMKIMHYWVQIAAAVLFLLAGGFAVMYLSEHQEMKRMAQNVITIRSGETGSSNVLLPDGTKVRLNEKSALSYKQDFGTDDRVVNLSGEGYFEVKRDVTKQFVVKTEYMDVKVLGTTFNVYAYEDKDFLEMTLVKGKVRVEALLPPYNKLDVNPNEKVTYDKKTNRLYLEKTETDIETAWINHALSFRHEKFGVVLETLERKFGVSFTINNGYILNDTYTGSFDDTNIESIMKVLKIHYGFSYSIKGDEIYLQMNKKTK